MTDPGEPAEIRQVRALEARADAVSKAFTDDPTEVEQALGYLDEAQSLAGDRAAVLAWLASRRATVWARWAEVSAPRARRSAWEAAVAARREAVAHTSDADSPGLLLRQANLAADLIELFGASARQRVLDEAVALLERVVAATPVDDPVRVDRAGNLAAALEGRFQLSGQVADLDTAVEALREAADEHPGRVATAVNLAAVHRTRFRAVGDVADLDAAEAVLRAACVPGVDPAVMSGLGLTLANRFDALGGAETLDEAVRWLSEAVEATPPQATARPSRMTNLALALLNRGEFGTGARSDFDTAVGMLRWAVEASSPESTERASRLTDLGGALRRRALSAGESADLDEALAVYREALAACPPGHVNRYAYVTNLANGLRDRYQRTGALVDLDEAIALLTEAAAAPNAGAARGRLLTGLGIALGERAQQTGHAPTLDRAIAVFGEALALTPPDSPVRLRSAVNLAIALRNRADDTDLDDAVGLLRAELAAPPQAHDTRGLTDRAEAVNVLAITLADLAERTGAAADVDAAFAAAKDALDATPVDSPSWPERQSNLAVIAGDHRLAPATDVQEWYRAAVDAAGKVNRSVALYTAGNWARWAENIGDWPSATIAYRRALDAMGVLDRAQLSRRDRERRLTAATGLAARAGYAALASPAADAALALRLVDRGQAVLLASALGGPDRVDGGTDRSDVQLAEVAEVSGEPVVCIGATARGGFALVLVPDGSVRHVALPGLTPSRVGVWAGALGSARPGGHLRPLLTQLWDDVMAPVLAELPSASERLTLIPAGSVRLLPLHAAARRDDDGIVSYLLDRAVISYAPNLRALLAAHRGVAAPLSPVLVVGEPADLRESDLELAAVRHHFPTAGWADPPATVDAVRDAMATAGLIHLACHGVADRDDPARSRLLLADGELTVRDILRLSPRRERPARLVVLSACESATIGDVAPDEAISLPVALVEWGAAAVVGTLWRVADESTAILVRTFYDLWRGPRRPAVADALAMAQRDLRRKTNAELLATYPELFAERARALPARTRAVWESARRYDDPYHWAPFLMLGR